MRVFSVEPFGLERRGGRESETKRLRNRDEAESENMPASSFSLLLPDGEVPLLLRLHAENDLLDRFFERRRDVRCMACKRTRGENTWINPLLINF